MSLPSAVVISVPCPIYLLVVLLVPALLVMCTRRHRLATVLLLLTVVVHVVGSVRVTHGRWSAVGRMWVSVVSVRVLMLLLLLLRIAVLRSRRDCIAAVRIRDRSSTQCEVCRAAVVVIVVELFIRQRTNRGVELVVRVAVMGVRLIVCGHRRVVGLSVVQAVFLAGAKVVVGLGCVGTWSRYASAHRRSVVVVIQLDIGQGRLRERLRNELTLLILKMGEITGRLFLCNGSGLGQALLILTLDDFGNTLCECGETDVLKAAYTRTHLVNLVAAVLLQVALDVT